MAIIRSGKTNMVLYLKRLRISILDFKRKINMKDVLGKISDLMLPFVREENYFSTINRLVLGILANII